MSSRDCLCAGEELARVLPAFLPIPLHLGHRLLKYAVEGLGSQCWNRALLSLLPFSSSTDLTGALRVLFPSQLGPCGEHGEEHLPFVFVG